MVIIHICQGPRCIFYRNRDSVHYWPGCMCLLHTGDLFQRLETLQTPKILHCRALRSHREADYRDGSEQRSEGTKGKSSSIHREHLEKKGFHLTKGDTSEVESRESLLNLILIRDGPHVSHTKGSMIEMSKWTIWCQGSLLFLGKNGGKRA